LDDPFSAAVAAHKAGRLGGGDPRLPLGPAPAQRPP